MKVIKKLLNAAVNGKPFANLIVLVLTIVVAGILGIITVFIGQWLRGG